VPGVAEGLEQLEAVAIGAAAHLGELVDDQNAHATLGSVR